MPNTESAAKRIRQDADRAARNRWRRGKIKTQVKAFLDAVHTGNPKTAEAEFRKAAAILDRVATTSTMHRNTAARKKSRMAKKLNALSKKS